MNFQEEYKINQPTHTEEKFKLFLTWILYTYILVCVGIYNKKHPNYMYSRKLILLLKYITANWIVVLFMYTKIHYILSKYIHKIILRDVKLFYFK